MWRTYVGHHVEWPTNRLTTFDVIIVARRRRNNRNASLSTIRFMSVGFVHSHKYNIEYACMGDDRNFSSTRHDNDAPRLVAARVLKWPDNLKRPRKSELEETANWLLRVFASFGRFVVVFSDRERIGCNARTPYVVCYDNDAYFWI